MPPRQYKEPKQSRENPPTEDSVPIQRSRKRSRGNPPTDDVVLDQTNPMDSSDEEAVPDDELVDGWEDVFGNLEHDKDDMDTAELQADEETFTRSMAKCSVRSSGGVISQLKSRRKYTRVVIPKSKLATPRDNFVGHVGHLSKAKSDELSRAQQQRHAQLRENELRVKIDVQRDRKEMQTKSTKDVYGRYQRHWNTWCDRKGYADRYVKQNRFQVYMSENLAPTGTDLYWIQMSDSKNVEMHDGPPSRSPAIQTLMHSYRLRLAETKTSMDPSNLVIEQGHEVNALRQVMRDGWTDNYPQFGGYKRHAIVGFCNRLNATWSHYMMSRSENMRMATFPDIFSHIFHPEKVIEQMALGITMLRGKTKREGNANFGVIVRNKDVELRPVGSLAFYLLELWQEATS
ncbi:MAG: hypothetical protein J3Q66DRAFT_401836 [Benniella sp.]|nr:MAG: hypothetical protein J3Q66DRAFT_401836 [Benniella sp.]